MKEILLTQGKTTIVDDEDYGKLVKYKWYAGKGWNTFYAKRCICINGKTVVIRMHREILGLIRGDGKLTDHQNQNGLDNRKINLRISTKSLNGYNCKMQVTNKSGYRGVSWHNRDKRWHAQIKINGIQMGCGNFSDLIKAAMAFDHAAIKYRGENAILNFPKETK